MDNTLIMPSLSVGSDPWFSYMVDQRVKEGYSLSEAIDLVLPLFRKIHERQRYNLVEPTIPELINYLKDRNIPTVILTNRGHEQKEVVLKKVSEAGLPLILTQFGGKDLSATFDELMLYSNGIIFCGKNDKGKMLFHILDTVEFKPSKIIFVDDKYRYLASVERACVEHNIDYVGIRYGGCDEFVAAFDPQKAEEELKVLFAQDELESIPVIP